MQQEAVSDVTEFFQRLLVAYGGWMATEVGGGHHQRTLTVQHQQMLERVRRQHHADRIQPRRNLLRKRWKAGFWRQHNRRSG